MAAKNQPLDDYRKKRDFGKTPEPAAARRRRRKGSPVFVIHRHEATNLHYDLRLEMEGVLKSWAVPRGFSYDPTEKKLAVRTEDHPIEHEDVDGVIPAGEYGAGAMTIWDRGTYRVHDGHDPLAALEGGEIKVILDGGRLRGEWHMVRTRDNQWLLFKHKDRYARGKQEPVFNLDVHRTEPSTIPRSIRPMLASEESEPFSDPDWLFEMEFDGLRLLAFLRGDRIELRDAKGKSRGSEFPAVVAALARLRLERGVLDGMLVALDEQNRPSRERLERRREGDDSIAVTYYAFDLLHYEQWDLRDFPLADRKSALKAVLPPLAGVLLADGIRGEGKELFEVVRSAGLPGVLAKALASPYRSGPGTSWRRIPNREASGQQGDLLQSLQSGERSRSVGRVSFTNLEKVYWPERGYTKGDLIDHYSQVAEYLLPYLADRPLHLFRFPDGIHGKSFYQKDAPAHLPKWVETETITHDDGKKKIRYIVCEDRETLLYLINMGSIDLHPWSSRRADLDSPDWAIIDLDPDDSPFQDVVRVARAVGKLLTSIGLRPTLKTSGASGIHIFIPLLEGFSYEQVRMFCEGVARLVVSRQPKIATVERNPARRGGRVYVDFLQNSRGQTVVPPYVVRPVPAASVSTPLEWDELNRDLDPTQFTIETVLERFRNKGDLFQPTLTDRQDLLPAIEALLSQ